MTGPSAATPVSASAGSGEPLTGEEKNRLFVEFNRTRTAYPDACIHTLFELQAEATPDRIALVYEDRELSYRNLNLEANRLAESLRRLDVGPETLVGLSIRRSIDLIVGILGILKAGGAYVPLDPENPRERNAMILEEARISVLVTESSLLHKLPGSDSKVICVDRESNAGKFVDNPSNETGSHNLAYVLFTSGSTGRPKGVMVEHRSVVRLVKNTNYADFSPENVFLQFAPITFDASTFEIWGALLNGASLVLMPDRSSSLEELGRMIREHRVTTLWLTAGLFHLMVDERIEDLRPVRQLLAGGDVLSVTHVQQVLRKLDCVLINGYGPTENTTFSCCFTIPRNHDLGTSVPIGTPISNTQVLILDDDLEPVAEGSVGELYVGGDGLARGYLNDPDLTSERFIRNPFSEIPSAKLFRTGDLARLLPDGTVAFLGRVDNQVKIRGFRIELEEIEVALTRHPAIREAVVLVRTDCSGDKSLVAFVVCKSPAGPSVRDLCEHLKQQLPQYMVPARFAILEKLPLTPNGKVDRAALPVIKAVRPDLDSSYVEPLGKLERSIAKIWAEVLEIEKVGVSDNFFELGGHSLSLARVHIRIQEFLGVDIPITCLFQYPTIRSLSEHLNRLLTQPAETASFDAVRARAQKQRDVLSRKRKVAGGGNSE